MIGTGPLRVGPYAFVLDHSEKRAVAAIVSEFRPHQRGGAVAQFVTLVTRLREFCLAEQHKTFRRSCACGMIWMDDRLLAVHLHQFARVIHRSKSFVNTVFQTIGYKMHKMSRTRAAMITAMFPQFPLENLRNWTFRELLDESESAEGTDEAEQQAGSYQEAVAAEGQGRVQFPSVYTLLAENGLPTTLTFLGRPEGDRIERA
jgi:hypothetical protein